MRVPLSQDEFLEQKTDRDVAARRLLHKMVRRGRSNDDPTVLRNLSRRVFTRQEARERLERRAAAERERLSAVDVEAQRRTDERLDAPGLLERSSALAERHTGFQWAIVNPDELNTLREHPVILRPPVFMNGQGMMRKVATGEVVELVHGRATRTVIGYGFFSSSLSHSNGFAVFPFLFTTQRTQVDDLFWNNRLRKAYERRAALIDFESTNAYRLVNSYADLIPGVVVDVVGDAAVVAIMPHSRSVLPAVLTFLADDLQVPHIYLHDACADEVTRTAQGDWLDANPLRGLNPREPVDPAVAPVVYKENGVRFGMVEPKAGLFTGFNGNIHKASCALFRSLAKGKKVATFGDPYGKFGAHALAGGAASVLVASTPHGQREAMLNMRLNETEKGKFHVISYHPAADRAMGSVSKGLMRLLSQFLSPRIYTDTPLVEYQVNDPRIQVEPAYDLVACEQCDTHLMKTCATDADSLAYAALYFARYMAVVREGGYALLTAAAHLQTKELFFRIVREAALICNREVQVLRWVTPSSDYATCMSSSALADLPYHGVLVRVLGDRIAGFEMPTPKPTFYVRRQRKPSPHGEGSGPPQPGPEP